MLGPSLGLLTSLFTHLTNIFFHYDLVSPPTGLGASVDASTFPRRGTQRLSDGPWGRAGICTQVSQQSTVETTKPEQRPSDLQSDASQPSAGPGFEFWSSDSPAGVPAGA